MLNSDIEHLFDQIRWLSLKDLRLYVREIFVHFLFQRCPQKVKVFSETVSYEVMQISCEAVSRNMRGSTKI